MITWVGNDRYTFGVQRFNFVAKFDDKNLPLGCIGLYGTRVWLESTLNHYCEYFPGTAKWKRLKCIVALAKLYKHGQAHQNPEAMRRSPQSDAWTDGP